MKSFSGNINSLIGEYKPMEIYSYYAVPNTGKTLFLLQEAVNFIKNNYRILWIDTEGGFEGLREYWLNKWNIKEIFTEDNFIYTQIYDYEELMKFFGFNVIIDFDKNKVAVNLAGEVKKEDTVYTNSFGRMRDKTVIIIDSMTSPFRLRFSDSSQNYPARATAMGYMVYALFKLSKKTNSIIIASHHASLNPTNPYNNLGLMRGGNTVAYYSKYIMYFEKPKKKALSNYRKIWGVRLPNAPDWTKSIWMGINDNGYFDTNEAEIEKILNGGSDDTE